MSPGIVRKARVQLSILRVPLEQEPLPVSPDAEEVLIVVGEAQTRDRQVVCRQRWLHLAPSLRLVQSYDGMLDRARSTGCGHQRAVVTGCQHRYLKSVPVELLSLRPQCLSREVVFCRRLVRLQGLKGGCSSRCSIARCRDSAVTCFLLVSRARYGLV